MTITKPVFELIQNSHEETVILRHEVNGSVTSIPADPANSDYQAYLESLETPSE